jgi:phosphoglycerol transferase MdoB-like AlkP superfamily enzyme
MKQKVMHKPFFHISTFAMLFFLIADACVAFSLKLDGVSRWSMYGALRRDLVLGFIFGLIAKKTGKSIFWASLLLQSIVLTSLPSR